MDNYDSKLIFWISRAIIILGIFTSIYVGIAFAPKYAEFNIVTCLLSLASSLVIGYIVYALGAIIRNQELLLIKLNVPSENKKPMENKPDENGESKEV